MPGFNNGVMYANNVRFDGAGYPGQVTADGQLLIGSTAAPNIKVGTLTAGAGISVTNASGSITIASTGSGIAWTVEVGNTPMVVNHGYGSNKAGAIAFTLPATSAIGSIISIQGMQGSWNVVQAAGQQIYIGSATPSTLGAGGSIASTNAFDAIELVCLVADTIWYARNVVGNITIV